MRRPRRVSPTTWRSTGIGAPLRGDVDGSPPYRPALTSVGYPAGRPLTANTYAGPTSERPCGFRRSGRDRNPAQPDRTRDVVDAGDQGDGDRGRHEHPRDRLDPGADGQQDEQSGTDRL